MIKPIIILLNLSLSILLISLISWFEFKESEINSINSKHLRNIQKLKKIPNINKAIEKNLRPTLKILPKTSAEADLKLITFFDKNNNQYNFSVTKYIYNDNIAHYLEIKYSIERDKREKLLNFKSLKFLSGFIQFKEFNLKDSYLNGTLLLIQPYSKEENNVSK
jgi:hypothetical protein